MPNKILDSEMIDKDQDFERVKQLRQQMVDQEKNDLLKAIAQKESSGGANIKHRLMNSTMHKGMRGAGSFGLMPISVKEQFDKSTELKDKYGDLPQDPSLVTEDVNNDPAMDRDIAEKMILRRLARLKDEPTAIYSWHNGVQRALDAKNSGKDLTQDPYTKEVLANLAKIRAEKEAKLRGITNE